ncbi:sugar transferase [Acidithiobacillus ferridurans]|uniref:sugar transferase n=1 Tax=Acidithiobacillus ferridurans TaxID=1232575 RepID=UPI001D01505B|nr:sugar transferase [Acidithiobacillus ferridurans]
MLVSTKTRRGASEGVLQHYPVVHQGPQGEYSLFFIQERVGRGGGTFACLKFRSMVLDAEDCLKQYLQNHPDLAAEHSGRSRRAETYGRGP